MESYEQAGSLAEKLGRSATAIRYLEPLLERLKVSQMASSDAAQLRRMQRVAASLVVLTLRVQPAERAVALQRALTTARAAQVREREREKELRAPTVSRRVATTSNHSLPPRAAHSTLPLPLLHPPPSPLLPQALHNAARSGAMAVVIDALMDESPVAYVNELLDAITDRAPTKSDAPSPQLQMLLLTQLVEESL